MHNGAMVVDADAHHMEPSDLWEKYIDKRFKSVAPRVTKLEHASRTKWTVEGEPVLAEKGRYKSSSKSLVQVQAAAVERHAKRLMEANYAAWARLADMDDFGVDAQILFPSRGGQIIGRDFK